MSDYDTALDIDPENFIGHYNRGLLRANVGDDNRAIEDFNFILKIDPKDIMATFNRAILLDQTGDYRGAIRDYTTVIKAYPKFLYGYQLRAAAKRKIGDNKGALSDEEHILKEQIAHRYGYSTATSRKKNTTRKKSEINPEDYSKLVVEDEQNDKKYDNEFRGKVQNKNFETRLLPMYAINYFYNKKAIHEGYAYLEDVEISNKRRLMPEKILINNYEANINEDEFNKRLKSIQQLVNEDKKTEYDYLAIAMDYYLLQDYDNAVEFLNEAIKINPKFTLALFQRAVVNTKRAEMKIKADRLQNKSINNEKGIVSNKKNKPIKGMPELPALETNQEAKNMLMSAKNDMQEVINKLPEFHCAHYDMAIIESDLNNLEEAKKHLDKAINIQEDFAEAYYNRGIIYIWSGDNRKGTADLSKAGELGIYSAYSLIKRYSK